MRSLGTSPTHSEVTRHLHIHKIERNGELDFSTFLTIMHRQQEQEQPNDEILLAMRMIDTQRRGYISAADLRARLTTLGEKLTNEEVDELFKSAGVSSDGFIHYEEFAKAMASPTNSTSNPRTNSSTSSMANPRAYASTKSASNLRTNSSTNSTYDPKISSYSTYDRRANKASPSGRR
ncbi:calmodulin-like protein 4 [Engraulis encrasicolus]|uniref:calmodulin-like protein 4 n=1 Tax=Engraulis encrasicolus TaxID=184585 RepID=UPI002FCEBB21